jgi:hypothetical protein
MGMAATLATLGPEAFIKQFAEIEDMWAFMIGQAAERAFALAPTGAARAMDDWGARFAILLDDPEILEAFGVGTDGWITEMAKHFSGFHSKLSPAVQESVDALMTEAELRIAEAVPGVFSPSTFFSTKDLFERVMFFRELGFSWAEAIALGFLMPSSRKPERAFSEPFLRPMNCLRLAHPPKSSSVWAKMSVRASGWASNTPSLRWTWHWPI